MDARERFWSKVVKTDGCWIWLPFGGHGYGRFVIDGRPYQAHRLSYEWEYGPFDNELQVDHLCRITRCVRPNHLEAVTAAENSRRSTDPNWTCINGHSPERLTTQMARPLGRGGYYAQCLDCLTVVAQVRAHLMLGPKIKGC